MTRRRCSSHQLNNLNIFLFICAASWQKCSGQPPCCCSLDGVVYIGKTVDVSPSTPGQFLYGNLNSPDYEVTYILEYSNDPTFGNLKEIDADQYAGYELQNGGRMGDWHLVIENGALTAGRYVFVKYESPEQKFYFPETKALQNGQRYWMKNYRISNGCRSSAALSEATTSPPYLDALGLPSPPSNISMSFSCDADQACRIDVQWSPSLDTGVGPNSSMPLPLNYSLRIFKNQEASATQQIEKNCPAFDTLAAEPVWSEEMSATSRTVTGLSKGTIYCIYVRARNNRLELYSAPAVLMARPIGPPLAPTQLRLLLNPSNLSNLTAGTVPGSVTWLPPADAGAGPGVPLRIVAYALELSPCPAANAAVVNTTTEGASFGYVFALRCAYVVRVAARNEQDPALGAFSQWGPFENLTVYVSQPANMSVAYVRASDGAALVERPQSEEPVAVSVFIGTPLVLTVQATMEGAGGSGGGLALAWVDGSPPLPRGAYSLAVSAGPDGLSAAMVITVVASADMLRSSPADNKMVGCVEATGGAARAGNIRARLCLQVRVIMPRPRIALSWAGMDGMGGAGSAQAAGGALRVEATVGCTVQVLANASDPTELGASLAQVRERGYLVSVTSNGSTVTSAYRSFSSPALPDGAVLARPSDPALCPIPPNRTAPSCLPVENWVTYELAWQPRRLQDGFVFRVCFEAVAHIGGASMRGVGGEERIACVDVAVARCRFCPKAGDSLQAVAELWRSATWLNVWSGNHDLTRSDSLEPGTLIQVGPVLTVGGPGMVANAEDVTHMARRFGVSVADLLWWNPDLADEGGAAARLVLQAEQDVCVIPNTCVAPGYISAGGF